jgi:hypothetical protein
VNDPERREFAQVFGEEELANVLAAHLDKSDRRAEGIARRLGGTLPDVRKGRGPRGRVFPVDSGDAAGDSLSAIDKAVAPSTKAKRSRSLGPPEIPTEKKQSVGQRGGKARQETVALQKKDYDARVQLDEAAAARALARMKGTTAAKELAAIEAARHQVIPPSGSTVPAGVAATLDAVWAWAASRSLGGATGPDVVPMLDAEGRLTGWEGIERACQCCGRIPCIHEPAALDSIEMEDEVDRDFVADYYDDDDLPNWLPVAGLDADQLLDLEVADEAERLLLDQYRVEAEEYRREQMEPWLRWIGTDQLHWAETVRDNYARAGIHEPPAEPFDYEKNEEPPRKRTAERSCGHCNLDPTDTTKDDLCQRCKRYKKSHRGQLPPPSVIDSRKRRSQ